MRQKRVKDSVEEEKRAQRIAQYLESKGVNSDSEVVKIGRHRYAIEFGSSECKFCHKEIYWGKNLTSRSGKTVPIEMGGERLHLCWKNRI